MVDGSVGLQRADLIALEMCEEIRRPYVVGHTHRFFRNSNVVPIWLEKISDEEFYKTSAQKQSIWGN